MRLHNNKASIKTWFLFLFLFLFLFFLVSLIIPKDFALSEKSNFNQYIMTFDPGFSSVENIANKGQSSNYAVHVIKLFNKAAGYKINPVILPRIDIDIDFNSYQLLLKDRKTAIKNNILTNPSKVPAIIRYKNYKYKAKVRLKGDLNDHWKSKHRISIKVQLKNKKTILGLSEFSVQKPIVRQFPYDHVFQLLQRDIGGMSPLNLYARVYINGSSMGVMNIEEGISKEFIEKQKK